MSRILSSSSLVFQFSGRNPGCFFVKHPIASFLLYLLIGPPGGMQIWQIRLATLMTLVFPFHFLDGSISHLNGLFSPHKHLDLDCSVFSGKRSQQHLLAKVSLLKQHILNIFQQVESGYGDNSPQHCHRTVPVQGSANDLGPNQGTNVGVGMQSVIGWPIMRAHYPS